MTFAITVEYRGEPVARAGGPGTMTHLYRKDLPGYGPMLETAVDLAIGGNARFGQLEEIAQELGYGLIYAAAEASGRVPPGWIIGQDIKP